MKHTFHQFSVIILLLIPAVLLMCGTCTGENGERTNLFCFGFSTSLFANVNENDAKASIRAWTESVTREYAIDADPSAQIFTTPQDIQQALTNRQVDIIGLRFEEYLDISDSFDPKLFFLTLTSGKVYEEYVLLVAANGKTQNVKDLKGSNLMLYNSARTSLAIYWLKSVLKGEDTSYNGLATYLRITNVPKISKAVLSVFFGKADACIVTNTGFSTMIELNPQIGRKLRIITKSRPLIPTILSIRKTFNSPQKEKVLTALRQLHTSIAGQQVLTIFQAEALVEVEKTVLSNTKKFILEARKIP